MAIFANSEKDAGFGIRTWAGKSVVKRNPIVPTDLMKVFMTRTKDKGQHFIYVSVSVVVVVVQLLFNF